MKTKQNTSDDLKQYELNTSKFIHELRNTLTLLKGTVQFIEQKHTEVQSIKQWKELDALVLEMENMLNDASTFNNCTQLKCSNTDLVEMFQILYNQYSLIAYNKGITFELLTCPNSQKYYNYYCDVDKLKHAFSNLIKNAIEACGSGNHIKVVLDLLYEYQRPSHLEISIVDDGVMIPEADLEAIFDPFITHKTGGTGLGLSIVKKAVELHNGSIQTYSRQDETCFQVLLPLIY